MKINKVVELKVEADLSDANVMCALRDAIGYSKKHKVKSAYIVLVPENEEAPIDTYFRIVTRPEVTEAVKLLNYCGHSLKVYYDYLLSVLIPHGK